MLKREWGAESNGKLPHLVIPKKTATLVPEFAVEDLPLGRTAALVPKFAVTYLPLGRTLWWWWWWWWWWWYKEPDLVKYIKINKVIWAGHLIRMDNNKTVKNIYMTQLLYTRKVGRPKLRWEDDVLQVLELVRLEIGWIQQQIEKSGRTFWRRLGPIMDCQAMYYDDDDDAGSQKLKQWVTYGPCVETTHLQSPSKLLQSLCWSPNWKTCKLSPLLESANSQIKTYVMLYHGRLARWHKWKSCDVGEAKERLENELWRRWSNIRVGEWVET